VRTNTTGGALHVENSTYTPRYNGWRFETGAGLSWQVTRYDQLYLDYEYTKTPAYTRPWAINFGCRMIW